MRARLEGGEEFLVERGEAACGIYHEHSHVGLVQGGLGPLDAQVAYGRRRRRYLECQQ